MTLRLLHSADWQLGRSFAGIGGDAAALLREARFEAVRRLARLAAEHEVAAVLVAGTVRSNWLARRCRAGPLPGIATRIDAPPSYSSLLAGVFCCPQAH